MSCLFMTLCFDLSLMLSEKNWWSSVHGHTALHMCTGMACACKWLKMALSVSARLTFTVYFLVLHIYAAILICACVIHLSSSLMAIYCLSFIGIYLLGNCFWWLSLLQIAETSLIDCNLAQICDWNILLLFYFVQCHVIWLLSRITGKLCTTFWLVTVSLWW